LRRRAVPCWEGGQAALTLRPRGSLGVAPEMLAKVRFAGMAIAR